MKYTTHLDSEFRYNLIVMKYTTHQTVQIQPNSHEVYYTPDSEFRYNLIVMKYTTHQTVSSDTTK